ncbi:hypothetical protein [Methylobacter sp.]|uniref:hypothetical protein n=1 Tax=Methylobacter sp. TaxID=2051955 RepID=UPI002FDC90F2
MSPEYPTIQSLAGAALAMMLKGEKISHLDFQTDTHSYCLRHPVYKLRLAGWPILDETRPGGIAKYSGRRTHYKVYFVDPSKLIVLRKELGERLDRFIAAIDELERRIRDEH